MQTILNTKVSGFANYNSTSPKPVNLLTWLTSDKYSAKVEEIRQEPDKDRRNEMKAELPAITPSGLFTQRNSRCLTQHSGFIQFDIDLKENQGIANYSELKTQVSKIREVAYCGLSVSGTGIWGLVPIADPAKHRQHYAAMEKAFSKLGITIDAKCKDVTRLRGYSYDANAYFNHNAKTFTAILEPPKPKPVKYKATGTDDRAKVEQAINRLTIDVTGDYQSWFKIGCSLANAFGEDGRGYYHAVSQYHPQYSPTETDRQYNACLKGGYSSIHIDTFFYYLKLAGIEYKNVSDRTSSIRIEDLSCSRLHNVEKIPPAVRCKEYALDGTPIHETLGYPVSWQ